MNTKNILIDQTIISGLNKGERSSFAKIYEFYKGRLYLTSMKYTKDSFSSEEVVANAFVKLWFKKEIITTPAHLQNWLNKIVSNESINIVRDRKKGRNFNFEISDKNTEFLETDIDMTVLEREQILSELVQVLFESYEKLPLMQKKVFNMHYLKRIPCGEIGEILNLSIQTIYNHLARAKKNIVDIAKERKII